MQIHTPERFFLFNKYYICIKTDLNVFLKNIFALSAESDIFPIIYLTHHYL